MKHTLGYFLKQSGYHPNWWYYKQNVPWYLRWLSKPYHLKMRTNPICKLLLKNSSAQ